MNFDFSRFISLSKQQFTFEELVEAIFQYTHEEPDREYRVIVGSDSEGYGQVAYATAIVVHRVGSGARAFICKNKIFTNQSLRQKIYNETSLSLTLAHQLIDPLTKLLGEEFVQKNLIIHVDIGQKGETKDMIREVTGMVRGSGFQVEIKPDAAVASTVADRFTNPPHKKLNPQYTLTPS